MKSQWFLVLALFLTLQTAVIAQGDQGNNQPASTGGTPAANEILNKSLSDTKQEPHFYKDDVVGNWIQGITKGDPACLAVLGVAVAAIGGLAFFASKKAPRKS